MRALYLQKSSQILHEIKASVCFQTQIRAFNAKRSYQKLKKLKLERASTIVQSYIRGYLARKKLLKQQAEERQHLQLLGQSSVIIQSAIRMYYAKKSLAKLKERKRTGIIHNIRKAANRGNHIQATKQLVTNLQGRRRKMLEQDFGQVFSSSTSEKDSSGMSSGGEDTNGYATMRKMKKKVNKKRANTTASWIGGEEPTTIFHKLSKEKGARRAVSSPPSDDEDESPGISSNNSSFHHSFSDSDEPAPGIRIKGRRKPSCVVQ